MRSAPRSPHSPTLSISGTTQLGCASPWANGFGSEKTEFSQWESSTLHPPPPALCPWTAESALRGSQELKWKPLLSGITFLQLAAGMLQTAVRLGALCIQIWQLCPKVIQAVASALEDTMRELLRWAHALGMGCRCAPEATGTARGEHPAAGPTVHSLWGLACFWEVLPCMNTRVCMSASLLEEA